MTLTKSLKKSKSKKRQEPLWGGPEKDGVTQSMLNSFLQCRERFRLKYIEGLQPADEFRHRLEYGQMWHVCEEAFADDRQMNEEGWGKPLQRHTRRLCQRYPLQQEQIEKWYQVCLLQFPIYMKYWKKHPDVKGRKPLLQEQVFSVPYKLPSGRIVLLRGKWDSVDLITKGIWLQENKTKGDIDEVKMQQQLQFDLQTMTYVVALHEVALRDGGGYFSGSRVDLEPRLIKGVRYNVIRRPLSGGKDSIRPHQATSKKPAETMPEFYARLGERIEDHPEHYFMRWQVHISQQDIQLFKYQFLDPVLEQLYDWWNWVIDSPIGIFQRDLGDNHLHYRTPFGIWNVLAERGSTEYDEYLASGSTAGLERVDKLFRELE